MGQRNPLKKKTFQRVISLRSTNQDLSSACYFGIFKNKFDSLCTKNSILILWFPHVTPVRLEPLMSSDFIWSPKSHADVGRIYGKPSENQYDANHKNYNCNNYNRTEPIYLSP